MARALMTNPLPPAPVRAKAARSNPLAYVVAGNPGNRSRPKEATVPTTKKPQKKKKKPSKAKAVAAKVRKKAATTTKTTGKAVAEKMAAVHAAKGRTVVAVTGKNLKAVKVNPKKKRYAAGLARLRKEGAGLFGDLKDLGKTLGELADTKTMLPTVVQVGVGAAGTLVVGTIGNRLVDGVLPDDINPTLERCIRAAVYAGTAVVGTRLLGEKRRDFRRRALMGGLVVAFIELAVPRVMEDTIRKVPYVGPAIAGKTSSAPKPMTSNKPATPAAAAKSLKDDLSSLADDLYAEQPNLTLPQPLADDADLLVGQSFPA